MSIYHEILGVPDNASTIEIKRRYKELARKYHPDVSHEENAAEKFIEITEAYEILTSKYKKANINNSQKVWEDEARNRAKQYAQMRYNEFKQKNDAFNMPMHSILWPKWFNFVILAFCFFILTDNFLPKKNLSGIAHINPDGSYSINNLKFKAAEGFENLDLDGKEITLNITPLLNLVNGYTVDGEFFKSEDRVKELWVVVIIITVLTIFILINKTKKLENKLLLKAFSAMLLFIYLIVFFTRHF